MSISKIRKTVLLKVCLTYFPVDGLIPADAAITPGFFTDFQNGDYVASQGFPLELMLSSERCDSHNPASVLYPVQLFNQTLPQIATILSGKKKKAIFLAERKRGGGC